MSVKEKMVLAASSSNKKLDPDTSFRNTVQVGDIISTHDGSKIYVGAFGGYVYGLIQLIRPYHRPEKVLNWQNGHDVLLVKSKLVVGENDYTEMHLRSSGFNSFDEYKAHLLRDPLYVQIQQERQARRILSPLVNSELISCLSSLHPQNTSDAYRTKIMETKKVLFKEK